MKRASLPMVAALLVAACSAQKGAATPAPGPLIVARPYDSNVPASYSPSTPMPLVLSLHGYGETPFLQDAYFGLTPFSESAGFLLAMPSGTIDTQSHPFWNATDGCCDFNHTGVDDVAYLNAVVDDMQARYHVDPKRIFIIGHSNGGFMAHRMACDSAPRFAAIVSLAGAQWKDLTHCKPSMPVAVLQVHGDADTEVPYNGGANLPSAHETVADWAKLNGCALTPEENAPGPSSLVSRPVNSPTVTERYPCKAGTEGAAELWTIPGAGHVPIFNVSAWNTAFYNFMTSNSRP